MLCFQPGVCSLRICRWQIFIFYTLPIDLFQKQRSKTSSCARSHSPEGFPGPERGQNVISPFFRECNSQRELDILPKFGERCILTHTLYFFLWWSQRKSCIPWNTII